MAMKSADVDMLSIDTTILFLLTLHHMHLHDKIKVQVLYLLYGLPRKLCLKLKHDVVLLVLVMIVAMVAAVVAIEPSYD